MPVTTKLRMDKGSMTFQATFMYWSTRTRGSVTQTQNTTNDMRRALARKTRGATKGEATKPTPCARSCVSKGTCQPPTKSIVIIAETKKTLENRTTKNIPTRVALYPGVKP